MTGAEPPGEGPGGDDGQRGGVNRRVVLKAAGSIGAAVALAGCSEGLSGTDRLTAAGESGGSGESTEGSGPPCAAATADLADESVKTRRTLYTRDEIANARRNVGSYDWARAERDDVIERVDAFLDAYTLDDVWNLVTGQRIPRSSGVDATGAVGSPTTGTEIYDEHGRFPWEIDERSEPWTVTDPTTGMTFPTNDFAAYRESGRDERGFFDPDLADDRYLVNERYPDRGERWGVDDGTGWEDADGNTFAFVAYYNHWANWRSQRTDWALPGYAQGLGKAYLFTGEERYGRAAAVLLDRIADVYPDLTLEPYVGDDRFRNSHGGFQRGKALGSEWETRVVTRLLEAYDAVFPMFEDERVVSFLSAKAEAYDLGDKSTPAAIRRNVENGIVRQVLPAVRNARIRGNFGMHQAALATSAVVLDEPDGYTGDAIDFVLSGGGLEETECGPQIDGGNVLPRLVGVVDRDGHNNEGAPNYHQLTLARIRELADVLAGYDGHDGTDLYENVKVERMHAGQPPLVLLGRYTPSIGDSGRTGTPTIGWMDREVMVDAFDRYGDAAYAQLAAEMGSGRLSDVHGDVFSANPEAVRGRIARTLDAEGPLDLPSQTMAGFGFSALRQGSAGGDGDPDTRRAAWLYYGRNSGHGHRDTLNLGVLANGMNLAPDLGYPTQTGPWPKRVNWTANTISHNTVVVDRHRQEPQWVAEPRHVDDTGRVSLVDIAAPEVYPETDEYRRTTVMVAADEDASYVVDFFRVDGGDDHHFSFHGPAGAVSTDDLDLVDQGGGTYAGPDVPKPGTGENTEYNQSGDFTAWNDRQFNDGFNYLSSVSRDDTPPERFAVDWTAADTGDLADEEVHLRLTMVGDVDDVALARGDPPDRPLNPDSIPYLLAHRTGRDIQSTFTSVIEPYADDRAVESVEAVPVTGDGGRGRAVRVTLDSGRTDYVATTTNPGETYAVGDAFEFSGAIAVYSERAGRAAYASLHDGTELSADGRTLVSGPGRFSGYVVGRTEGLTRDTAIEVELGSTPDDPAALVGRWVFVDTDGDRNGAYEIEGVSGDGSRLTLHLGDQSIVRGYVDSDDPDQEYEYLVDEANPVTIPLVRTWRP